MAGPTSPTPAANDPLALLGHPSDVPEAQPLDLAPTPVTTVPLTVAQQLLAQPITPQADPQTYVDAAKTQSTQTQLPKLFNDVVNSLTAYNQNRQAQLAAADAAAASAAGQASPDVEYAQPPAAPAASPGLGSITAPTTVQGTGGQPITAPPVNPDGSINPSSDAMYQAAVRAGLIDPGQQPGFFGKAINAIGNAPGVRQAVEGVTGAVNGVYDALPDPAKNFISTVAHGYQQGIEDSPIIPVLNMVNTTMLGLTRHTLDPVINATLPAGAANPLTDTIDTLGTLAPWVALEFLSGGAATGAAPEAAPALGGLIRPGITASFGALGSKDAMTYWQQYKEGNLTNGQFIAGMGLAALNVYAVAKAGELGKAGPTDPAQVESTRAILQSSIDRANESAVRFQTTVHDANHVSVVDSQTGDVVTFEKDPTTGHFNPVEGHDAQTGQRFKVNSNGDRVYEGEVVNPEESGPPSADQVARADAMMQDAEEGQFRPATEGEAVPGQRALAEGQRQLPAPAEEQAPAQPPATTAEQPFPESPMDKSIAQDYASGKLAREAQGAPYEAIPNATGRQTIPGDLAEIQRLRAEARSITDPAERAQFMKNHGITRSMEELAIDRGEMRPEGTRAPFVRPLGATVPGETTATTAPVAEASGNLTTAQTFAQRQRARIADIRKTAEPIEQGIEMGRVASGHATPDPNYDTGSYYYRPDSDEFVGTSGTMQHKLIENAAGVNSGGELLDRGWVRIASGHGTYSIQGALPEDLQEAARAMIRDSSDRRETGQIETHYDINVKDGVEKPSGVARLVDVANGSAFGQVDQGANGVAPTEPTVPESPMSKAVVQGEGGEKRAVAGFDKSLIPKLGEKLYEGDLGVVATKELLQNAVDAVRGGAGSKIDIAINTNDRTIHIEDNGHGMTPDVMQKEFVDIGGSVKQTEDASGGFGLAKVAILANSANIDVVSKAKNPDGTVTLTQLTGTGEDWALGQGLQMHEEQLPAGSSTGTRVNITIADKPGVRWNQYAIQQFVQSFTNATEIPGVHINATINGTEVSRSQKYITDAEGNRRVITTADYTPLTTLNIPGASLDVKASPGFSEQYAIEAKILNNGLYQFSQSFQLPRELKVPNELIINVRSDAGPDAPNYPFTTSRERMSAVATETVQEYVLNNLARDAAKKESEALLDVFRNAPEIPDPSGSGISLRVYDTTGVYDKGVGHADADGNTLPSREELAQRPYMTDLNEHLYDITDSMIQTAVRRGLIPSNRAHASSYHGIGLDPSYLGVNIATGMLPFNENVEGEPTSLFLTLKDGHTAELTTDSSLWHMSMKDSFRDVVRRLLREQEPKTGTHLLFSDIQSLELRDSTDGTVADFSLAQGVNTPFFEKTWGQILQDSGAGVSNASISHIPRDGYVILNNPYRTYNEIEQQVRAGLIDGIEGVDDNAFIEELAGQGIATTLHEVTHVGARGHGTDFSGALTRLSGHPAIIRTMVEGQARLAAMYRDMRDNRPQEWEQFKNDSKQINRYWDNESAANLLSRASDSAGATQPAAGGDQGVPEAPVGSGAPVAGGVSEGGAGPTDRAPELPGSAGSERGVTGGGRDSSVNGGRAGAGPEPERVPVRAEPFVPDQPSGVGFNESDFANTATEDLATLADSYTRVLSDPNAGAQRTKAIRMSDAITRELETRAADGDTKATVALKGLAGRPVEDTSQGGQLTTARLLDDFERAYENSWIDRTELIAQELRRRAENGDELAKEHLPHILDDVAIDAGEEPSFTPTRTPRSVRTQRETDAEYIHRVMPSLSDNEIRTLITEKNKVLGGFTQKDIDKMMAELHVGPPKDLTVAEIMRVKPSDSGAATGITSEFHGMLRSASPETLDKLETSSALSPRERDLVTEEKLTRATREAAGKAFSPTMTKQTFDANLAATRATRALSHADSVGKLNGWMRARGIDPAEYTGKDSPYWTGEGKARRLDLPAVREALRDKVETPLGSPYDRPYGEAANLDDGPALGGCSRI